MDYDKHFPSSPRRLPILNLNISTPYRKHIGCFCTYSSAHAFLKLAIPPTNNKPKWLDDHTIYYEDHEITVHSLALEEILESTPLPTLPAPYPSFALAITGRQSTPSLPAPCDPSDSPTKTKKAPRAKKSPRASDSVTTAQDIAETLNMTPQQVRRILRSLNIPKPYSWDDPEQIQSITDKIRKAK